MKKEFFKQISINTRNNYKMSNLKFAEDINIIIKNLNKQCDLLLCYFSTLIHDPYAHGEAYTEMIFSAIYKNLLSLCSALELTRNGQCGSARMIFRNIYENLIISKFISIKKDNVMLNKWEKGEDISVNKEIFKNIKKPNSDELKDFWKSLCCYVHGTVYSQQIGLKFNELENDINLNFVFIKILLCINYHVMNTYALNQNLKYYTKFGLDCVENGLYNKKISEIRYEINVIKKSLLRAPRRIIYDFCLKWEV